MNGSRAERMRQTLQMLKPEGLNGQAVSSPYGYAAALTALGYGMSIGVIWLITQALELSTLMEAVIAATVLVITMLPAVVVLVLRPMKRHVQQQELTSKALAEVNAQLEARVSERTQELARANEEIQRSLVTLEVIHQDSIQLSQMIDLLQASRTTAEAEEMLDRFGKNLFAGYWGAIYLHRSSRNVLERASSWGKGNAAALSAFAPDDCWALRRGRQHLVYDADKNPPCRHTRSMEPGAALCVPMIAQGDTTGVLVLHSLDASSAAFSERILQIATSAAEQIALALANLQLRERLLTQAIRDPLTAMFNRRYFEETAERELRKAQQAHGSAGFILIDIDHFKRLNDTHGHEAGDITLKKFGLALQNQLRVEDVSCRYGGEEFIIMLPGISLADLVSRANQIREAVKEMDVRVRGEVLGGITISCGVSIFPEHGVSCADLIESADRALYRAKHEGRDRVAVGS